ncbi:MAG: hypothetical protein KJ048_12300 [Dehalococcoidia bacterium]|nr:hypothetical protein [Dehalococcoidia bacterium]
MQLRLFFATPILALAVALTAVGVGCSEGESAGERIDGAVDAYNRYVEELSAPIATTAESCLRTGWGSPTSPPCRRWIAWTQDNEDVLSDAINALSEPFGDDDADRYRRALLSTLREYRRAFSEAADAVASGDRSDWITAMTRFRAAQEQGRRADEIRFEILSE